MVKVLLSMTFYVVLARWMYAELNLVCPSMTSNIDKLLSAIEIPTHDNWHEDGIRGLVREAITYVKKESSSSEKASVSGVIRSSISLDDFGARIYNAVNSNERGYSFEEFGRHIRTHAPNFRAAARYTDLGSGGIERF